MKKTIALILTLVMLLALAVPTVTATEAETQTSSNAPSEGYKIDFNDKSIFDWSTLAATGNAEVVQDGYGIKLTPATDGFRIGGELEGYPIDGKSIYTIEFSHSMIAANTSNYIHIDNSYVARLKVDKMRGEGWSSPNNKVDVTYVNPSKQADGDHTVFKYRVVVDTIRKEIRYYYLDAIGHWVQTFIGTNFNSTSENLHLSFRVWTSKTYATFSDVTVYKGIPGALTDNTPGRLLLDIGNMSETQTNAQTGATYTPDIGNYVEASNAYAYSYENGVHSLPSTVRTNWAVTEYGGTTNLPLGTGYKYTVEYMVAVNELYSAGLAYSSSGRGGTKIGYNGASQSIYMYKGGHFAIALGASSGAKSLLGANVALLDAAKQEDTIFYNDGYAKVSLEINEYMVTVYINGVKHVEYSTLETKSSLGTPSGQGFATETLTIAFNETASPAVNSSTNVAQYKDIKVYSGLTVSKKYIPVIDGETTTQLEIDKSETNYTLPTEAPRAGYMFKGWKVNNDATLTASGTAVPTATLEKLEMVFEPIMSEMWWHYEKILAEDNETDTGKRNIRFVSVIDSLNYSKIGYTATISYGDKEFTDINYELKHVYESLSASYGQDVITIEKLGYESDGYIVAFVVKNVPANVGPITFTLTPYQVSADGTQTNTGAPITFTLTEALLNQY